MRHLVRIFLDFFSEAESALVDFSACNVSFESFLFFSRVVKSELS